MSITSSDTIFWQFFMPIHIDMVMNKEKKFSNHTPSGVIIAVEVEHMVPGSLQKLPICFCFRPERQNAAEM